jgi:hypothetical protein
MKEQRNFRGGVVGLTIVTSMLLSSTLPAQTVTPAASPADVNALVSNIKGYYLDCHSVAPSNTYLLQNCAQRKNGLLEKQKALSVSNNTINKKLNGGGTLRGGWRWP